MFSAMSQQRYLKAIGRWDLTESESDAVIATRLDEIRNGNDYHWYLLFEHYQFAALYQRQTATRVLSIGIKPIEEVATELTKMVQQRLLHTEAVVFKPGLLHDRMWPGPSSPEKIASASKEEKFPLLTFHWQLLSRAINKALTITKTTASPMLALTVLATQIGVASCPETTTANDASSSTWWLWMLTTLTMLCWTALLFRRAPYSVSYTNRRRQYTGKCRGCEPSRTRPHHHHI